jgi:type I restriction enzyme R subunit
LRREPAFVRLPDQVKAIAGLLEEKATIPMVQQQLDREAAKQALNSFTAGKTLSANQMEFVNLIVDHLAEHGAMNPELLCESPFTDVNQQGPEGVFDSAQIDELVTLLDTIRRRAVAA